MTTKYWIGGTGTWSLTNDLNWSTTSGGANDTTHPITGDDVVLDGNSGTGVITLNSGTTFNMRSLNCTGYTGTLTFGASSSQLNVGDASGGAFVLASGMTLSIPSGGTIQLLATTTNGGAGWPVTTAGKTLPNLSFAGSGGKWVQTDALVLANLTHNFGTWDTASFTVTCSGSFNTSNSNVRTLTLGSSSVTCSGQVRFDTIANLAITANTATLTQTTSSGIWPGGANFNGLSLVFTGTTGSNITMSGTATFANITKTGGAVKTDALAISNSGTLVATGTFTVTGNSVVNRVLVSSGTAGTARTITAAAVSLSNVDFMDITATTLPSTWVPGGTGNNLLSADAASFETSTGGWTGVNVTLARTTAAAADGAAALTGTFVATGNAQLVSPLVPVTAGSNVTALVTYVTGSPSSVELWVNFYDAGSVLLSGTFASRASVNTGVAGTHTATVPAGATQAAIDIRGLANTGQTFTIDRAALIATSWTGTSLGDALGNTNIAFTPSVTRYGVVGSNWSNTATWSTTSGGVGGASVPLPQDDVILDANSAAGTYLADMPRWGRNINFTGFTRTINVTTAPTSYGNFTHGSGMTWVSGTAHTHAGRGSHTITHNGKSWPNTFWIFAPGGTYTLADAAVSLSANSGLTFNNGTLVTNGFSITGYQIAVNGATLTAGTSTFSLTGGGWTVIGTTSTLSSSTVIYSAALSTSRNFLGGGNTYGTVTYTVANSPGALVVTGANTFGTLNIGSGRTLTLPSSTTTTVTNLNIAGKTTVVDTFTRADSSTTMGTTETGGLTWTPLSGTAWGITSNQAQAVLNIGQQVTVVDAASIDVDVSVTMTALGDAGIVVRATDDNNYWMLIRTAGGTLNLYQRNAGTFSSKATASPTFGSSAVFRLTAIGDVYTGYLDGVQQFTFTDSFNNTATKVGLRDNSNTARFDNFSVIALSRVISSSAGTAATLSKSSGYIAGDYLYVKDITFSGGGTFYAGSRSTNVSNNTGVTFTDAPQRYWVGGTALWDNAANQKWAVVSGGTGGIALPTASTDVFFDANSGTGTVTVWAANVTCRSLICTGYTGTLATGSIASGIVIGDASGGALTFSSGMTVNMATFVGTISFVSTSSNGGAGWAVTTAGKTLPNVTFNGTGGKWVLADAFSSTATFGLTAGTAVTAGFTLNVQSVTINNNAGSAKTLDITNSVVNMTGGWAVVGGSNTTLIATGSTINSTGGDGSLRSDGGPWTYNDINITVNNANNRQIGSAGSAFTCNNLTITGTAANRANVMTMQGVPTITGTLTITGNSTVNRMLIWTNVVGTTRTVTAANVALSNVDFMDIAAAGASAPWTGTSLGDGLGNSNITFPASVTRYAVAQGNWSSTATWSTSSGGAGGASVPLPQDDVYMDANSGAGTYTIDMPRPCRNLDCTGFTRTLSHALWDTIVFGSITLSATTIINSNRQMSLGGRGSHTLTSAGHIIGAGGGTTGTWTSTSMVNSPGATYTMLDALGTGTSSVVSLGTLVTNNFAITSAPTGSGSLAITTNGALQAGTSTISLGGTSGSTFTYASTVTSSLSQATFVISSGASASRNFNGGGQTYGTLTYTVNSFSQLVITGANTFNTINVNSGKTLTLPSSITTVVNNWNVVGQNFGYLYLLGGTNSSYASVPHSAALGVSDLDVRVNLAMDTWTPSSSSPIISKWPALSGDMSWLLYAITGGQLQFWYSRDGTTASSVQSSVATGFAAGSRNWVRVTRAAATGTVTFYTSSDGSTWNQLGTTQATTAGSLFAGTTTPVMVGADKGGNAAETVAGKFYRAQMRNNVLNDGTGIVLDIDFSAKAFGVDTFTESSTNAATVTIGASAITGDGRVAVNSSSVGTQAYLLQAGVQTSSNYLTVKDIVVSGTLPAWSLGGTGGNLLTAAESSFEGSVGSWGSLSGSSSTVVTSTEVAALVGTSVGKATSASANLVVGPTANVTATAGTVYVWRFSTRAATVPRTWGGVGSYNGFSGNYGNSTAPTDAVGSWTDVYGMGVAPVGTNNVSIRASVVMVAGEIHYLDAAGIYQAAQGYAGRTSVDKGNNTNWLFVDLINAQNIPLQSTSTLTAGPLVTEPGAATLASTSTLTTQLTYVAMGAATMASTSTLAVQAAVATTAAVQLQATSTLVTTPQVTVQAFASFLSTSTLLASASLGKFVTADLTSSSVLVAQAIITKFLSVSLLSSSIASVGGIVTTFGFVNLRSISISTTMPTFYLNMTWAPGSLSGGFKATMDESWKMSLC